MFTLRCTRKLLKRLGATPSSEVIAPTTVLGDWTANLLYLRPQQLVLAMNERSLLSVLVPASPGRELRSRVRDSVAELLLAIGVPAELVATEILAMETMAIGATASRAVLGCMNDAVVQIGGVVWIPGSYEMTRSRSRRGHAQYSGDTGRHGGASLGDAALHLAGNIYSLTDYQKPWVRALELFGVEPRQMQILRTGRVH